ncbi:Tryptophan aminotransferase-related protein 3 [Abeliophyllum distichum]|uniref:Tryptophan aminotransferase-related protein 3 n=1 Tax=Abeliophyllum distichum TaxID=126358 RepID=A0ABD1NSE4_9LAMI
MVRRWPIQKASSVNAIYDHAYYWPHFSAIPAQANGDIMIFTISKLTGHAGSRFGWALVKDKDVYLNMLKYMQLVEMGVSRDTQLRALQLLKVVLEGDGREIFHLAYEKMRDHWEKNSQIVSLSKRFTNQDIPPQYCNFFEKVRGPSPGDTQVSFLHM